MIDISFESLTIMLNRRFFAVAACSLLMTSGAHAWSWGWGSETVNGSGEVVSELRELPSFDAISLAGGFQVIVRQNPSSRVEVRTDKNLQPLLETRIVEGGKGRTLEIAPKKGSNLNGSVRPQIIIDMAQLRALAIGGSGDIKVETMKTASVDANIGGSGDINFVNIESESLAFSIAGSGDIKAGGTTQTLRLSVAGSGDVRARGLQAEEVKASIAGSGSAEVFARKTLNVSIAGSGDVAYLGAPELKLSVAGNGKVKKLH